MNVGGDSGTNSFSVLSMLSLYLYHPITENLFYSKNIKSTLPFRATKIDNVSEQSAPNFACLETSGKTGNFCN